MALVPGVPAVPAAPARIMPATPTFDEAFWVAAAENVIRNYCGWHIAPITTRTVALDGQGRRQLLLPTMRLLEVVSVSSGGFDVTARVKPGVEGVIELEEGFGRGINSVVATIRDGYDAVEQPDILALIASLASRFSDMFGNVVQTQAAGGSSVSYFPGSESLMASDRARLQQFKLRGRT